MFAADGVSSHEPPPGKQNNTDRYPPLTSI
jgi:hypothetical protein